MARRVTEDDVWRVVRTALRFHTDTYPHYSLREVAFLHDADDASASVYDRLTDIEARVEALIGAVNEEKFLDKLRG